MGLKTEPKTNKIFEAERAKRVRKYFDKVLQSKKLGIKKNPKQIKYLTLSKQSNTGKLLVRYFLVKS